MPKAKPTGPRQATGMVGSYCYIRYANKISLESNDTHFTFHTYCPVGATFILQSTVHSCTFERRFHCCDLLTVMLL